MTRPAPSDDLEPIDRLLAIMARLRDRQDGCPWDVEQTFATIAPYTVEEAYEVADAIERGDLLDLKEELGDLLLQVVFHARMGEEAGAFDFDDVARAINDKMVRRHPHVFADENYASLADQKAGWEQLKAAERQAKAKAAKLAGYGWASLLERIENTRLQFRRDTHATVLDLYHDVVIGIIPSAYAYLTFSGSELHRIVDQVPKDLLQSGCVGPAMMFCCIQLARDLQALVR